MKIEVKPAPPLSSLRSLGLRGAYLVTDSPVLAKGIPVWVADAAIYNMAGEYLCNCEHCHGRETWVRPLAPGEQIILTGE